MNWDLFFFGLMVAVIFVVAGLVPTSCSATEILRRKHSELKYHYYDGI